MSGLDPLKNTILEFACILSDRKLTTMEEGPHIIIHCDEEHLKGMDEWNTSYKMKYLDITPNQDYINQAYRAK